MEATSGNTTGADSVFCHKGSVSFLLSFTVAFFTAAMAHSRSHATMAHFIHITFSHNKFLTFLTQSHSGFSQLFPPLGEARGYWLYIYGLAIHLGSFAFG
jgi:hypothetical protein